jgi:RimJ/RimL family protein N-acetyltransferase
MVPSGFSVHSINNELLAREQLHNRERLVEEILSEGPSVEYWLENGFGFSMMTGDKLVGWCLSEHNCGTRCEIGIEIDKEYRKQGVATVLASALVEHALAHGITEIGWHTYARNAGSIATARKVGFEKAQDYSVYYARFSKVITQQKAEEEQTHVSN